MTTPEQNQRINELWAAIKCLRQPSELRYRLGEAFQELRGLYSERERKIGGQSAEVQGHGTFEAECNKCGFKPRTVRDLITDYEIEYARMLHQWRVEAGEKSQRPEGKTSAEKRREARQRTRTQRPRRDRRITDQPDFIDSSDDFARFARLLPYNAAKAAFREAAKRFHPDHGGNEASMIALNLLWEKLEPLYRAADGVLSADFVANSEGSIQ